MYRIISGKWKAKKISAPKNFDVRPTTDFAKEALFSILQHQYDLEFCTVLDLFCGIGSVTLEFASRDCQDINSVDINPKHIAFINTTAAELEMAMQIKTYRADVFDFVRKNKAEKTYDIIFADPPFDTSQSSYEKLVNSIFDQNFLKKEGTFVLEHQSKVKIESHFLQDSRKYGNVSFSFFRKSEI